jgi:hypothetical protein
MVRKLSQQYRVLACLDDFLQCRRKAREVSQYEILPKSSTGDRQAALIIRLDTASDGEEWFGSARVEYISDRHGSGVPRWNILVIGTDRAHFYIASCKMPRYLHGVLPHGPISRTCYVDDSRLFVCRVAHLF